VKGISKQLPVWGWWLGIAAIGAIEAVVLLHWQISGSDRGQQYPLMYQLSKGHLADALGPGLQQTSGPGFGVFAPVYWLVRQVAPANMNEFRLIDRAMAVSGIATLPFLAWAWVFASRAAGIARRSALELIGLLLAMTGVPVVACLSEAFHPADLLATAAVLAAFGLAMRGRIGWCAVALGFGLATRQWVVVAIAVFAVLHERRDQIIIIGGSIGVFAAILLPFMATGPEDTMNALSATSTIRGGTTAAGLVPYRTVNDTRLYVLSRYLPLVVVVIVCLWLVRRRARFTVPIATAALTLTLSLRVALDPAGLMYYAAPGYVFLLFLVIGSWRRVAVVVVAWLAIHYRTWTRHRFVLFLDPLDYRASNVAASIATTVVLLLPIAYAWRKLVEAVAVEGDPDVPVLPADGEPVPTAPA
jgi:hypothetical protein